jgi:hypothetical protein
MRAASLLLLGTCAIASGPGCLRSPSKIPAPGEGLFVSGVVVARDLTSAEIIGVQGATVRALGSSKSTLTDARGFFQLERLPLGRVRIFIDRPASGSEPDLSRILDPIDGLVDGQVVDVGQIELSGSGDLTGFVGLDQGAAVPTAGAGALVVATDTVFKAIAGEDGRFLIAGLPEGAVDLVALEAKFKPAHLFSVHVTPGETTMVQDLVLHPDNGPPAMVEVKGTATLDDQANAAGIQVTFIDETDPTKTGGMTMTDASGAYDLTIPAGVYRARFERSGYCTAELPSVGALPEGVLGLVTIQLAKMPSAGGSTACNAMLPPPGLDGGVTNSDGGPILGPVIDSIDPEAGAAHTTLVLHGRNFFPDPAANTIEFGQPGPIVQAFAATGTMVQVSIPETAISGPITLFSRNGIALSPQPFTLLAGPIIFDFAPKVARVASTVEVVGRGFLAADGSLSVLVQGTAGGMAGQIPAAVRTGTSGKPLIDKVVIGGTVYDRARFVVPDHATSGRFMVQNANGSGSSSASLTIQPGPTIEGINPNPATVGGTIAILGQGFSTADTGGQVTVSFTGSAMSYGALGVTNTTVLVEVPSGTQSGPITVHHPAGDAVSTVDLVIDNGLPVIQALHPSLIMADGMHTLTITGVNLQGTTAVHFPGGVSAAPAGVTAVQLSVLVPTNAQAGPVTIDVTSPTTTSTSSRQRLRILARSDHMCTFTGCNELAGIGYSQTGGQVYAVSYANRTGAIIDPSTLDLAGGTMPIPLGVSGTAQLFDFQVSPNGQVAILRQSLPQVQTFVLEVPSFNVIGSCAMPDSAAVHAASHHAFVFDLSSSYAYAIRPDSDFQTGTDGIFRVNLATGACDIIAPRSGSYAGIAYKEPGALYVADPAAGLGIMDVESGALLGTLIQPYEGAAYPNGYQLIVPASESYILGIALGPMVQKFAPFMNTQPTTIIVGTGAGGFAVASTDRRWAVFGSSILDLDTGVEAWYDPSQTLGAVLAATAHPLKNTFVVTPGGGRITRLDILE